MQILNLKQQISIMLYRNDAIYQSKYKTCKKIVASCFFIQLLDQCLYKKKLKKKIFLRKTACFCQKKVYLCLLWLKKKGNLNIVAFVQNWDTC